MKKRVVIFMSGLLLACGAQLSMARGYVGVGVGSTTHDQDGFKDDSGVKFGGGVEINDNFFIEAGYTSLGKFEAENELLQSFPGMIGVTVSSASMEITGIEFSGLGVAPINENLSIYGRLGIYVWDADINVSVAGFGSGSASDDGSDPLIGLGMEYNATDNVGLRLEYTRYDAEDADIDYLGGSLVVKF
jgi:OmpA-OmpF porin, OOP family